MSDVKPNESSPEGRRSASTAAPSPPPVRDDRQFQRLFDVSPHPAVVTRLADHTVLAISQHTSELFGVAQDEARGQSVLSYYVDAGARERLAETIRRHGRADGLRLHVKRRNGDTFWVQASARLVKFENEPAVLTVFNDITEQLAAEEALKASEHRLETQSRALTELTDRYTDRRGGFDDELREILRAVAHTLVVERVSMWRIDQDRRTIRCVDMFQRTLNRFESGAILARETAPDYFDALERDRVIAAEDVLTDPRTREFKDSYLVPNNIGAMLDIPLRLDDRMTGVLCCEHVGGPREWFFDEQNFATSSANLIAAAAVDAELRDAAVRLAESEARAACILAAAADAFAGMDAAGRIVSWNTQAETLFRWTRLEAIGRPLAETIIAPPSREALLAIVPRLVDVTPTPAASSRLDLQAIRRDGHELPVSVTLTAVRQAVGLFVGLSFRDLSARD